MASMSVSKGFEFWYDRGVDTALSRWTSRLFSRDGESVDDALSERVALPGIVTDKCGIGPGRAPDFSVSCEAIVSRV